MDCVLTNMCRIYDRENDLVLVQDKIHPSWGGLTFPGGKVEKTEGLVASTKREVLEETGFVVDHLQFCGLVDWCNQTTGARWLIFLYETQCFTGELIGQSAEGKVFWMPPGELEKAKLSPNFWACLELYRQPALTEGFSWWSDKTEEPFSFM